MRWVSSCKTAYIFDGCVSWDAVVRAAHAVIPKGEKIYHVGARQDLPAKFDIAIPLIIYAFGF